MNWEAIGAIGELLAAIGVIISLVFVGLQISKGNEETRAATMQAAADAVAFFNSILVNHSDTWDKIVTGNPLESGSEMRRGIILYNLMMTENENRYHQFNSGYLDSRSWDTRSSNLQSIVKLPIFKKWRVSFGGKGHDDAFLDLVDKLSEDSQAE